MLLSSKFRPAWWLRNAHAQTIWAARVMRHPLPATQRERLTTADGDFLDLDWSAGRDAPLVVIFHGLGGSLQSAYARASINAIARLGMQAVLMHFRGCSGEPNQLPGSYHSGHTTDIAFVIETLRRRFPQRPIGAIGYSLGGNALLKYLGANPDNPLTMAVSVSPPLVLAEGAKRLSQGVSKLYEKILIDELKRSIRNKLQRYPALRSAFPPDYEQIVGFRDFDNRITAPLHGFTDVDDYYRRAGSRQDLPRITTRTHILFARDDPFFTQACIPAADELAPQVTFELAEHGGHVGFVSSDGLFRTTDWLAPHTSQLLCHALSKGGVTADPQIDPAQPSASR